MKKVGIKIYGLVQGIGFRFWAKEKARKLGISVQAENKPDGSVCVRAEGDEKALEKFIEWCHTGPEMAKVEKVEAKVL
jgi:acylphosphatase